jgi:hypothetical protein
MSKYKVLRREFVTAAFCAVLSAPPPAHAQSHPAGPKATILPCEGPCALMQWARLAISLPGAKKLLTVPTSMDQIERIQTTPSGNIIALGGKDNGLDVLQVVDPAAARSLAEVWTVAAGVAPDNRTVAFTVMVATHGPDSEYSDKMIYVLDADRRDLPAQGWAMVPDAAIPVFPASLVKHGQTPVMQKPASRLASVVSLDLKFLSNDRFMFLAAEPHANGATWRYLPITITAGPGGDWKHAAIGRDAPPFRCDLPDNPTVETILAKCGKGK